MRRLAFRIKKSHPKAHYHSYSPLVALRVANGAPGKTSNSAPGKRLPFGEEIRLSIPTGQSFPSLGIVDFQNTTLRTGAGLFQAEIALSNLSMTPNFTGKGVPIPVIILPCRKFNNFCSEFEQVKTQEQVIILGTTTFSGEWLCHF
ncbi:MAG: hypothetical protein QNK37_03735 [Acidobacteriota bacterium]|nr:hypothetical protein [Acidobacteriota bacterium]